MTASGWKSVFGRMTFLLWAGILFATLYPFQFHPCNDVSWIQNSDAVRFGRHGVMLTEGSLAPEEAGDDTSCSIEILLRPATVSGVSTFLTFSSEGHPGDFWLRQYQDGIIIWRDFRQGGNQVLAVKRDVDHFFIPGQIMLLTLSSGPKGTSVYSNGKLLQKFPAYPLSRQELVGQLVFGTDPSHIDPWSGELRGLALYDRELQQAQVLEHYEVWNTDNQARLATEGGRTALFLFKEHKGKVVHNLDPREADLLIPPFFQLPQKAFLAPPWKEFSRDWDYLNDVLRNIVGFIPFGFAACGYFSFGRAKHRAVLIAILLGAFISLGIEILQAFIPQRESGMTDVLTNTMGTVIGAMLLKSELMGRIFPETKDGM
jgi:uncharacterized membrane protein